MLQDKILSICIPTFANPSGIEATITDLFYQARANDSIEAIEFCVADNSEDELTGSVIKKLKDQLGVSIKYLRHGKNLGYDRNVAAVIELATSEYCWLLSDNENIKNGSLKEILKELENNEVGLLIICPKEARENKLKTYRNMEEAITENDYWIPGGLVSRNIIKRSLIPNDLPAYFGNYWLHLSITTSVGAERPVKFISEKFIDDKNGLVRWAKNGTTFITYTSLLNIITSLPTPPYSTNFIKIVTRRMLLGLPKNIISAKLYGLKVSKETIARIRLTTGSHYFIFLLSLGALLIPTVLLRYGKNVQQSFNH